LRAGTQGVRDELKKKPPLVRAAVSSEPGLRPGRARSASLREPAWPGRGACPFPAPVFSCALPPRALSCTARRTRSTWQTPFASSDEQSSLVTLWSYATHATPRPVEVQRGDP